MPIREDLLTPIPGDNPSGTYLYYAPIYDKIKEARRQDEDSGPSGVWTRERKMADWNQVIKLAGEALATQSKDLQLAAWLTEAYFKKEGFSAFRDSLVMLRQLVETFWDTIYPEIEDGDAEFRATPLSWIGNFDLQIKMAPITRGGLSAFDYRVASSMGTKQDAENGGSQKLEEFNAKVAEGKTSLDEFDGDFDKTPKKYYVELAETFVSTLEELENLQRVCEEKFGDDSPGFSKLRGALEETQVTVKNLLNRKREKEPDAPAPGEEPVEEVVEEAAPVYEQSYGAAPVAAPVKKKAGSLSAEPQDADDALARIVAVARYLRVLDIYSPAPYLMLAGFRFGELRSGGDSIDAMKLEAPPTEIRQGMKKASMESNWEEVYKLSVEALALPCGRGWLDLHRYAAKACTELGWYHEGTRRGIVSMVRGMLQDYPDLHKMTLMDDTPTANGDTLAWIESDVLVGGASAAPAAPAPAYELPPAVSYSQPAPEEIGATPDAWELAQQALRAGRVRDAVEMIDRECKMERSGRGRFLRKTQLARIFIDSGNESMALPILEQLGSEIESRGLEDWEPSETIAHPLTLLYRCLSKVDRESDVVKKLYAKLCRLDPVAAMSMLR